MRLYLYDNDNELKPLWFKKLFKVVSKHSFRSSFVIKIHDLSSGKSCKTGDNVLLGRKRTLGIINEQFLREILFAIQTSIHL